MENEFFDKRKFGNELMVGNYVVVNKRLYNVHDVGSRYDDTSVTIWEWINSMRTNDFRTHSVMHGDVLPVPLTESIIRFNNYNFDKSDHTLGEYKHVYTIRSYDDWNLVIDEETKKIWMCLRVEIGGETILHRIKEMKYAHEFQNFCNVVIGIAFPLRIEDEFVKGTEKRERLDRERKERENKIKIG